MAKEIEALKVVRGAKGKLFFNGKELAEINSVNYNITANREDMMLAGKLTQYGRVTSLKGEGTFVVKKTNSMIEKELMMSLAAEKDVHFSLMIGLDDKDTKGSEYVGLNDCWVNNINNLGFELGQLLNREVGFGFDPEDIDLDEM
ncbi:phage tail tube protein [Anaerophilus nitritogenes]|uniref:phage tail tube protein n=1 Tax=Anaerophilus nitritogenes TaxID=2498136 RepID=UPI00101D1A67|nr:phage tail tube protein [Anaerophilus nitritogenes]